MSMAALGSALAQDVPPPPKPGANPSLAETMKFIQDKLNGQGAVNWVVYMHDNLAGKDWTSTSRYAITNVRADAANCRIDLHALQVVDDKTALNLDTWVLLKSVTDVAVSPAARFAKEQNSRAGHPGWDARVDPPVFTTLVNNNLGNGGNVFMFYDESLANRVAQAFVHAVELCGGGAKEPF